MTYSPSENLPSHSFPSSSWPWFAVRVKSNCERSVSLLLDQKGYQRFLPTYRVNSRWSDRVKAVERVLFPGYLFCSFDPARRLPIVSTAGVVNIVGVGNEPIEVPEIEIAAVWATVRSGLPVGPWPSLRSGDWVIVERGPLTGLEGRITQLKGNCRLVVSVTLLQRSIAAEIERDWVRPLRRGATQQARPWKSSIVSGHVA